MKHLTLIALLLASLAAGAQHLNSYTLSIENDNEYQSIATTGTRLTQLNGTSMGSNYQQSITLPFDFEYGTYTFTQGTRVSVCSSGRISIGSSAYCYSYGYMAWNTPDNDEFSVWPFLCGSRGHLPTGSACYWQTMPDDMGGQMLVIEWKGMRREGCTGDNINYQLHLHSNGDIAVHYGRITIDTTWFDSLFSFMILAGSASDGYCPGTTNPNYIDRQMITGTWNGPVTNSCIQLPNPATAGGASGTSHHVVGVPDSSLLLTYQRPLPPCPHPDHFRATDVSANIVTLLWDGNGVAGVQYRIEYDTVSFTPGTGSHNAVTVTDTTLTLITLLPDHHYWFHLRALCNTDSSEWRSLDFITSCEGMDITDLPYSQDFNSGNGTVPPDCWRKVGTVTFHSGSGSGANRVYFCNISNLGCYAVAPPVNGVQEVKVSFRVKGGPVAVGVMDGPYDTASFDTMAVLWANNADWYDYTVRFRGYRGGGQFIAFTPSPNQYGMGGCEIDDVVIDTVSGCQPVEFLSAMHLTATSATINWHDPDTGHTYRLIYWAAGTAPDTIVTSDTAVTLNGLAVDVDYTVSVTTVCGTDSTSLADSITVHLVCQRPTTVRVGNITGHTASVSWHEQNDEVATYRITLTDSDSLVVLQDTVSDTIYALTGLASRTSYTVGVSRLCFGSWTDERTDTFTTDYACGAVDSLTISNISDTTALLTIHDGDSAGRYCVVLGAGATSDTLYTTSHTLTLAPLSHSQHYSVSVAVVCPSDSTFSPWVDDGFNTPCHIITHADLPYTEDFENCVAGDKNTLNPCWTYRSFAPSNYVGMYRPSTKPEGTGLCLYGFARNAAEPFYMALPEVDSLDDLSLSFWAYISWTGDTKVDVGVMSDPDDTTTFTTLYSYIPTVSHQWVQVDVNFNTYTGTGRYPALRCVVMTTNIGDPVYFDDIVLRIKLSCEQPDSLYVSDITDSTATLHIVPSTEGDSSAASYRVVLTSETTADTLFTTSLTVPLTGLGWKTEYGVEVRSICPEGGMTMATNTSFTTLCRVLPMPYTEGFEAEHIFRIPRCWEELEGDPSLDVRSGMLVPSGSQMLYAYISSTDSAIAIASPELQPQAGPVSVKMLLRAFALEFISYTSVDTMPVNLELGVLTDSLHVFYSLKHAWPEWETLEVVGDDIFANGGRLVIRMAKVNDSSSMLATLTIDDIRIGLPCQPVTGLTVATVDSVPAVMEVRWTPQGDEQQWQVELGVVDGTTSTSFIVNEPRFTIYHTQQWYIDTTRYWTRVQPVCGEGDTGDWSDTVQFVTPQSNPTGIDAAGSMAALTVSPNPASTSITVGWQAVGDWRLDIIDLCGRHVLSRTVNGASVTLDMSALPRGLYFLQATSASRKLTRKLILQ